MIFIKSKKTVDPEFYPDCEQGKNLNFVPISSEFVFVSRELTPEQNRNS